MSYITSYSLYVVITSLSVLFSRYYYIYGISTACDLKKSFSFDKTVEITSHVRFPIIYV